MLPFLSCARASIPSSPIFLSPSRLNFIVKLSLPPSLVEIPPPLSRSLALSGIPSSPHILSLRGSATADSSALSQRLRRLLSIRGGFLNANSCCPRSRLLLPPPTPPTTPHPLSFSNLLLSPLQHRRRITKATTNQPSTTVSDFIPLAAGSSSSGSNTLNIVPNSLASSSSEL